MINIKNDVNKLLIGILILLFGLLLDRKIDDCKFGFNALKREILQHGNVLKAAMIYQGGSFDKEMMVASTGISDGRKYINQEAILSVSSGVVVKANSDIIVIKDYYGKEYSYTNFLNKFVNIYESVSMNQVIAIAKNDGKYYYDLVIK